jgi:hypothetical protein
MNDIALNMGCPFQGHAVGLDLADELAENLDRLRLQTAGDGSTFANDDIPALNIAVNHAIDLDIATAFQVTGDTKIGADDGGDAAAANRTTR